MGATSTRQVSVELVIDPERVTRFVIAPDISESFARIIMRMWQDVYGNWLELFSWRKPNTLIARADLIAFGSYIRNNGVWDHSPDLTPEQGLAEEIELLMKVTTTGRGFLALSLELSDDDSE